MRAARDRRVKPGDDANTETVGDADAEPDDDADIVPVGAADDEPRDDADTQHGDDADTAPPHDEQSERIVSQTKITVMAGPRPGHLSPHNACRERSPGEAR